MAIIKVTAYPGQIAVLQAVEGISNLHSVIFSPIGGVTGVAEALSGSEHLGLGIARGTIASGKLARILTHGFISGVICAAAVQAGDRLTIAGNTSGPGLASGPGLVTPFNTITPAGAVSGYVPAPAIDLADGSALSGMGDVAVLVSGTSLLWAGGLASGITGIRSPQFGSGSFGGTAFNTGRVLGRAFTSGGVGSGIQMYVCVE